MLNRSNVLPERRMGGLALRAETRAEGEMAETPTVLRGHAAVFNSPTNIWDMFEEQIAPGAFVAAVERDDVRALWNHDPSVVLGRNRAGTLELEEDEKGLHVVIHPPDTQAGRDALTSVARGDVTQMSFSFRAIREAWEEREGKLPLRTLLEVELFEISPVTFPAYEATEISARSAAQAIVEARQTKPARAAFNRMKARLRLASAD